jgi:hypothetical protein
MIRKRTFALAQDYVEKHFGVRCLFPIKPGKKFPPLIRDNLAQASSDPAQLAAWEKQWPGCNWGLSHKKSGVLVADIDVNKAKGKIGDETYLDLDLIYGWPETEMTTTPSGGFHKIYIGPHIMALGANGIGRDIDSPNYTLIPGCTFDDGTSYVGNDLDAVKCPEWIYDTIKNSKAKSRIADAGDVVVELDQERNIETAIDFLINDAIAAIEGSGGDFNTLKTAMYLKDLGISPQLAPDLLNEYYNPRCEPPWDIDDLIKKVTNAYNYATLSKVGGKTAEADFSDDPPPPVVPMGMWDNEKKAYVRDPKKAKREKRDREKGRTREAAKPINPDRAKTQAQVLDTFVWVVGMERFINIVDPIGEGERDIWKRSQFDSEFNKVWFPAPKRGSASDYLLRLKSGGMQSFYRVAFKPGQPRALEKGMEFNMYREPDISPVEGDITWWNEHLEYLLPEQEYRDHLLNWMAWLLQNLAKKPKHALILQGEVNGTGKSFVGKVLTRILHQANASVVPQNSLSGRFNSWALQCKLIVVEELRASDKRAVKEALHDIITEDRINVEKKGVDSMMVDTCFGVLAFTNDFAALDLDNTDRRYLVISTERTEAEAKAKEAAGYFIRLFAKLEDDGAMAAVAYSLMNRDLKGYNGQSAAPMTAAKENMKTASMNDIDHYLADGLVKWPLNGRVVCIDDVILDLPRNLSSKSTRLVSTIKTFLMRNGAIELGQCTTPKGERPRLYAMGPQAEFISLQTRSFAGKLYEDDNARTKKNLPPDDLDAGEEFGQPDNE